MLEAALQALLTAGTELAVFHSREQLMVFETDESEDTISRYLDMLSHGLANPGRVTEVEGLLPMSLILAPKSSKELRCATSRTTLHRRAHSERLRRVEVMAEATTIRPVARPLSAARWGLTRRLWPRSRRGSSTAAHMHGWSRVPIGSSLELFGAIFGLLTGSPSAIRWETDTFGSPPCLAVVRCGPPLPPG